MRIPRNKLRPSPGLLLDSWQFLHSPAVPGLNTTVFFKKHIVVELPSLQAHLKCIVDLDNVESADDAPDTSYYQWVTFMFAIQAAIFFFPYKLWKSLEGGLIESFGTDGKTPIMISEEAKYDDGVVQEAVIEKFVKYFKSIFHHNSWYFASYVFCKITKKGFYET